MSRFVLSERPCGAIGSDHRPDPQGPGRNGGSKSNANLHDTLVGTVFQDDGRRCAPPSADPIRRACIVSVSVCLLSAGAPMRQGLQ